MSSTDTEDISHHPIYDFSPELKRARDETYKPCKTLHYLLFNPEVCEDYNNPNKKEEFIRLHTDLMERYTKLLNKRRNL